MATCVQVHVLGLWGMGGIGKTTLASALYNELLPAFGGNVCFVDDIRSQASQAQGLLAVQRKLLKALMGASVEVDSKEEGAPRWFTAECLTGISPAWQSYLACMQQRSSLALDGSSVLPVVKQPWMFS